ncbi:MAG: PilZ domain-containing protein [Candidatus Omnitrophica bacterium]|nr:PilZ domain-containing protein [Candidatus Omnitrophota bacterium]
MGIESRKFIRLHIMLIIDYSSLEKPRIKGRTLSKDIALGGINIFITEKIDQGAPLSLEIQLPDESSSIRAKGNIMWQNEVSYRCKGGRRYFLTGIQFGELAPVDKVRLLNFIVTNLKDNSEIEERRVIDKIEEMRNI